MGAHAQDDGASMAISSTQAAQFFEQQQAQALQLIGGYEHLITHSQERVAEIDGQIAQAQLDLAAAYLPTFTPEALKRVETLTGFLGFSRRDPIKAMEHERTVLAHTLTWIAGEKQYQDRELLAGPDGTLSTKLVEVREMLAPWAAECDKYEALEGFLELVHLQYDTPKFSEKWWQASYWKHWAMGDRICAELGVNDFGDDVWPAYKKAAEQRAFWQGEEVNLVKQVEAVHDLVRQHDEAQARLPQLPQLYLQQCHEYLGSYLAEADPGLLEEWLLQHAGKDRPALMALRRLAGLVAKKRFLQELVDNGLQRELADMRTRVNKYSRKIQKYLRPKNWSRRINERDLDHKFAGKVQKYHDRQQKLGKLIDRLYGYDTYGSFNLSNDPALWWMEFTGKRPPRQMPTTRSWYDRHSEIEIAHDAWDDWDDHDDRHDEISTAVATAAVARELDDVGYLS